MSKIQFLPLDRDYDGTTWKLIIPAVQGSFDLLINGYFRHYERYSKASYWELFNFHKSNTQEATAEQIENLLGHGCRDRANEILEGILGPKMELDYYLWLEFLEQETRHAELEAHLNNSYFQKMSGF